MFYLVKVDNKDYKVEIKQQGNTFAVSLNNQKFVAEVVNFKNSELTLLFDHKLYQIVFDPGDRVIVNDEEFVAQAIDESVQRLIKTKPEETHKNELSVLVPMPGLVIEIEVKEGAQVKKDQGLVIVEAMKMQNEIKAPRDGVVKKILVKKGQTVNSKDPLLIIE